MGPCCLILVPGVMQDRGNIGWVCESLLKEIGVWTLDWLVCISNVLTGKSLTISRN